MSTINVILISVGILLFFWLRYRKILRKHQPILMEKQIQIHGEELRTPLSIQTPLSCLLDDGKKFGRDFKNKEKPQLPHVPGCQCQFFGYSIGSREWFDEARKIEEKRESDLGELEENEAKFYKYRLIAAHGDLPDDERALHLELSEKVTVSPEWKDKVSQILAIHFSRDDRNRSSEEPR